MPRVLMRSRPLPDASAAPHSEVDVAEVDLKAEAQSGGYDTVADLRSPGACVWHPDRPWVPLRPKVAQALQTIVLAAGGSVQATSAYRRETEDEEQSAKETAKARKLLDPGSDGKWQLIQSIPISSDGRGRCFAFRPATDTSYYLVVEGPPVHIAAEIQESRPTGSPRVYHKDIELLVEFSPIECGIDQHTGQAWFGWHLGNHGPRTIRLGAPLLEIGSGPFKIDAATDLDFQSLDNRAFALRPEGLVLAPYSGKKYVYFQYTSRALTADWLSSELDPQGLVPIIKAQLRWFASGDEVPHNYQILIIIKLRLQTRSKI